MSRPLIVARRELPGVTDAAFREVVMEEWVPPERRDGRQVEGYWRPLGAEPPAARSRGVVVAALVTVVALMIGVGIFAVLTAVTRAAEPAAAATRHSEAAPTATATRGRVRFRVAGPEVRPTAPGGRTSATFRVEVVNGEPAPLVIAGAQQRLRVDSGNEYGAAEIAFGLRPGEVAAVPLTFGIAAGETPTALTLVLGGEQVTVAVRPGAENPVDGRR